MEIIQGKKLHKEFHYYLKKQTGAINIDKNKTIGYINNSGFGVVGFNNYYKDTDIEIHAAGNGSWMNKKQLKHMFTYIFKTLNCKRLTARIASKNKKSINLVTKLGFIKEGEMRGLDIGYYSLLRQDCIWAV